MAIDQRPILIAGPPRSGTIMLAGLLYYHGIWIGRARTTHYPGSNPELAVENLDIKAIMKREALNNHYRNWRVPIPAGDGISTDVKEEIESFVPEGQRWLVKTSWVLTFHRFWNESYPEALWILPHRREKEILRSMNRHPGMKRRPDNMKRNFVQALQVRQHEVAGLVQYSLGVDVMKVSRRDRTEIERFFEFVNILIDWEKVNEWIQPGRMSR